MDIDILNHIKKLSLFFMDSNNFKAFESSFLGYCFIDGSVYINENNAINLIDKETPGCFVVIKNYGGYVTIFQDYHCSFGLYLYRNKNYWAISNSFFYLLENLSPKYNFSINNDYLSLYIVQDVAPYCIEETIINEISEIKQGDYINIEPDGNIIIENFTYNKFSIPINSSRSFEIIDEWYLRYYNIIKTILNNGYNLSCDLSGGKDSRMSFSLLRHLPLNSPNLRINSAADKTHTHSEDFRIATEISTIYNFQLNKDLKIGAGVKLDSYTSLMISLYAKFFFHDEYYFSSKYYLNPTFSITGSGGELLRKYLKGDCKDYCSKYIKFPQFDSINLNISACAILKRIFQRLDCFEEDLDPAQKSYVYGRVKNHFMRTAVEHLLVNNYSINPLLDPKLLKINFNKNYEDHDDLLIAVILNRFVPELDDLGFDNNRMIPNSTFAEARCLNAKYSPPPPPYTPCMQYWRQPESKYILFRPIIKHVFYE